MAGSFRIAADIGGTFTDVALLAADGRFATCKVPSTPADFADAVLHGVEELLGRLSIGVSDIVEVLHACTVATNAVLEFKGARTALITTKGFRDLLELRRIRVPQLYNPLYLKPPSLVPRNLCFEVEERIDFRGAVLTPLGIDELPLIVDQLRDADIEAIAVCLLHAYANPEHERRIGEHLRRELPGRFVSLSSEVLPELREYERASTTVVNAYVGPPVERYLASLVDQLRNSGITAPVRIMQSSGGMLDISAVRATPAQIVECGPAAGVKGAAFISTAAGYPRLITFDMGGTTAKASIVEEGEFVNADEHEVGGGISLSSCLVKGGGYALKLPAIDISEVGAGGGSIVWLDKAKAIKVGPQSAGAVPGPACYAGGSDEPTVTDANVILGFLNPEALAGGTVPIDAGRSRRAVQRYIAGPLECSLLEAAYGIHMVANSNMMRAVKSVTTYRGRDPRDFAMFAFGGNGGVHAVELARALRIEKVLVPPAAGVFSALGLLFADMELTLTQAHLAEMREIAPEALEHGFRRLEQRIAEQMGSAVSALQFRRMLDVRYLGQAFELTVPLADGVIDRAMLDAAAERFEVEHERNHGHRMLGHRGFELVNLRVTGSVPGAAKTFEGTRLGPERVAAAGATRDVYFGPAFGSRQTAVVPRSAIGSAPRCGPLVIEEYEGTTVVPPDCTVALDSLGNLVIAVGAARSVATSKAAVDPFLLEVIKSSFDAIADQMALMVLRTAYSSIVRDSMDFSTAVCDAQGRTLAQGLTNPVHLGSFYQTMRCLIERFEGRIDPGDVFVFNDPYACSGQHLPDVYIVKPIFHDGRLVAYATTLGHQIDVGGIVPGSNALGATEIFQEGLRLPILKFMEKGQPCQPVWDIIALNVRVPDMVLGDLQAQMAACAICEREVCALFEQHGSSTVAAYVEHLHDYAERLTRAAILEIPDGEYRFTDHIDGLGEDPEPVVLNVRIHVHGDTITVDWTGSSPQVAGGINSVISYTTSCVLAAVRSILPADLPNCHGYRRPIEIIAPPGSITHALFPAPCGARGITGYRMIDCMFGALAEAVPERVTADSCGGATLPTIAGYHLGQPFVFCETIMGNWGAAATHDGQDGVAHLGANMSNVPVEMLERQYPIRIECYGLLTDTGGAGRFRGGLSIVRQYRMLADRAVLTVRSDKRRFLPHGLFGGGTGAPSWNLINPDGQKILLPVLPLNPFALQRGDVFRHVMAGAGGYGDPLERDAHRVLRDVIEDKVSRHAAEALYGVVIGAPQPPAVDVVATETLRTRLRRERSPVAVALDIA